MSKTPLYIIPARGGSKGIPRKNIKNFAGTPLIHYSIDVARKLSDDKHIIAQALLAVGLPGNDKEWCASDYMAHSDGEKQRILIAKAIAQQTPVILLDEPTAHLDLPNRIKILLLLKHPAHEQQKTILISTHELDLAIKTSDRILLLAPDRPFRLDTPKRLMETNAFNEAFGMDIFSLPDLGNV